MKILLLFFARYLLAPLFVTIMVFVLTSIKAIKQKLNIKRLIIFILIASIVLAVPCLFGFLKNEFVWGGLVMSVLTYFFLGCVFQKLSTTPLFNSLGLKDSRSAMIIVITILCVLGGWCYFLLFELISQLPYSLICSFNIIWFAVPSFIVFCNDLFLKIPQPIYTPWELDNGSFDRKYWDNVDSFGSKSVKVKIKRKFDDNNYASLVVRMPNGISIGNWFNWFVEDQNRRFPQNQIEVQNSDSQIGWMFYTSKWFNFPLFIRILDCNHNSEQAKIKNNQTIYIHRVKTKY